MSIKSPKLFLVVLALVAAAGLWVRFTRADQRLTLDLGGFSVRAEVAETPEARARGLSGHAPLSPDEGMLFRFGTPGRYAFWMSGMTFPIDIIWLRDDAIVDMAPTVPPPGEGQEPPLYWPRIAADAVLEVSSGTARSVGLRIGDTIANSNKQ